MDHAPRSRWIGAIPYFPGDRRLWIRGPAGAMKPNAGRPAGLVLWLLIGLVVLGLVGLLGWLAVFMAINA